LLVFGCFILTGINLAKGAGERKYLVASVSTLQRSRRIIRPKSEQPWAVQMGIVEKSRELTKPGSELYVKA